MASRNKLADWWENRSIRGTDRRSIEDHRNPESYLRGAVTAVDDYEVEISGGKDDWAADRELEPISSVRFTIGP